MRASIALTSLFLCLSFVAPAVHSKTLRFALSDDATTLDPHVANLAINTRLLTNVYEGLVMRDKDYNIAPALAVSWSQPDAKTWRFRLRPDVKFHDGSTLTADDVVFSVGRALHPLSNFKWAAQGVGSAKKVDDLTVELIMAEPNPVLLLHLNSLGIMSKAWSTKHKVLTPQNYADKEETFASRAVNGTGPFTVTTRAPDVKTVLTAHREWWNRAAADRGNLTAVEWTPIKSNGTRMAALLSGAVDFVADPPVQDRDRVKNSPALRLNVAFEPRVIYFGLDQWRDELLYSNVKGKNPFKDLRVRQAMAHVLDAQLIIDKVTRGYGRPTGLIVGSGAQGYAADIDRRLPVDLARARKLMAEAGYPSGFEVRMDCLNQTPFGEICQAAASQLAPIGIKLTLNMVAFANLFQQLTKYDTSAWVMGYGAATMDAHTVLQAIVQSPGAPGSGRGESNWGRFSNAKVDTLIDRIRTEVDAIKRNQFIREVLTIQRDELAVIPLYQVSYAWAMRKGVEAPVPPQNTPYWYRFKLN